MSKAVTSWPIVSLYDFCKPKQWPTIPQTAFVNQGYPVYGANGKIGHFTEFNHERATVLITCRGATCGTINVSEPKSYVTGNAMALDELDESRVSSEYLVYALRNGNLAQAITGTAQPQITRQSLTAISIPLPPLVDQRRIAKMLDRVEALRAKRLAALGQLDLLTQSLFLDLFGDPVLNPRRWLQESLETFFHFRTGKLDSNAAVALGKYPFFTCSREDFRIDTFAFDCEALLLAGNNASADYSVKHYKGKFNAYQRTYVITLRDERNSYDYSRFVLEHRLAELKRISKGTNTKYLTMELLNRIRVPVPPVELQCEFARRVRAVEKLKMAERASLAELDSLFATLQHRAFRGEL